MTDRVAKTLLYEQFARVGKALASPVRLELLDLLAQGERGVEDLAAAAGLRLSNASAQAGARLSGPGHLPPVRAPRLLPPGR